MGPHRKAGQLPCFIPNELLLRLCSPSRNPSQTQNPTLPLARRSPELPCAPPHLQHGLWRPLHDGGHYARRQQPLCRQPDERPVGRVAHQPTQQRRGLAPHLVLRRTIHSPCPCPSSSSSSPTSNPRCPLRTRTTGTTRTRTSAGGAPTSSTGVLLPRPRPPVQQHLQQEHVPALERSHGGGSRRSRHRAQQAQGSRQAVEGGRGVQQPEQLP